MPYQLTLHRRVDRTKHVWLRLSAGRGFKCVICGGISSTPDNDSLPDRFEKLTQDERDLCPVQKDRQPAP